LRFADYFFDSLFVDWEVKDRIKQSIEQVGQTRSGIESVLNRLKCLSEDLDSEIHEAEARLERILSE